MLTSNCTEHNLIFLKPTSSANNDALNFSATMSNLQSMFPNINNIVIENVLQKNNGDVTNAINELLNISTELEKSSLPTSSLPSYEDVVGTSFSDQNRNKTKNVKDECEDDEKIALLLQNREFLRYLQQDKRFMNEIAQTSVFCNSCNTQNTNDRNYNNQNWFQCNLPSKECINQYSMVNKFYNDYNDEKFMSTETYQTFSKTNEKKNIKIPNGPIINFTKNSILNDYSKKNSKTWTSKVKSRIPLINKTPNYSFLSSNYRSLSLDSNLENDTVKECDYCTSKNNNFVLGLRNLSKNSKTILQLLFKKFLIMKRANHEINQWDNENIDNLYEKQFKDNFNSKN